MKINEIFMSIQGEGLNVGMPQIFIRTFGCNMKCKWCDTKYANVPEGYMDEHARAMWRSTAYKEMDIPTIINVISEYVCKSVCITGGEPMIQRDELYALLIELRKYNYYVQLFTNGTIYDKEIYDLCDMISMDMKAPSSEMKSDPLVLRAMSVAFPTNTEIKVVVSNRTDLHYALYNVYNRWPGTLILQPTAMNAQLNLERARWLAEQIITKHQDLTDIRVMVQMHKIIWQGVKRGK